MSVHQVEMGTFSKTFLLKLLLRRMGWHWDLVKLSF